MTDAATDDTRTAKPHRAGYATICWAVVQGGFALHCALTAATPADRSFGPAGLGRFVVVVAALAAVAAVAAVRLGNRPVVRALLWVACGLSLVSAFSLLMDVVGLLFAQGVDSPAAAVLHALGLLGAVLLAATARSYGSTVCARCGTVHETLVRPEPSRAPRPVRLACCAGALAFLPFVGMKVTWAVGGTFAGVSSAEMLAASRRNGASGVWLTLESWGLDGTTLLAALGVFLLFGLIRPWGQVFPRWTLVLAGRRVPRWLPLTPALIGAATLAPYGLIGTGYTALATAGVVPVRRGDFRSSSDVLLVSWIGFGAFALYGGALILAARSYWLRTRPLCRAELPADRPESRPA
ncbi:hypothetical protein [Streptomyces inhibens]|nr:hypothetical protein [Streptomyces inhibens]